MRPLAAGIGAFGAGLVLSGTAGAMWLFILGWAIQGFGGGLMIVALCVVVSRAYAERLRPAIMAAFAASWVIPSVVGPLVSGTVTERLGRGNEIVLAATVHPAWRVADAPGTRQRYRGYGSLPWSIAALRLWWTLRPDRCPGEKPHAQQLCGALCPGRYGCTYRNHLAN